MPMFVWNEAAGSGRGFRLFERTAPEVAAARPGFILAVCVGQARFDILLLRLSFIRRLENPFRRRY